MAEEAGTSEVGWSEEEAPRRKRRVPPWVWWSCGGGCLLVLLVVAVGFFALYRTVKEGMDEDKQWPHLQEVLAFEERPPGLHIDFGSSIGFDQFRLRDDEHHLTVTLYQFLANQSGEYKRFLDPDVEMPFGLGAPMDPEAGKIVVQGREVQCLRFSRIKPEPASAQGVGIRVDLTGDRARPRTLELRSTRVDRIEDELVTEFLAPFDVWKEP